MARSRKVEERLRAVWDHAAPISGGAQETPWRYVPQSYNGGHGWGVFDRKEQRYVDTVLAQIPLAALRDELLARALN